MRRATPFGIVLLLFLSGCAGSDAGPANESTTPEVFYGSIQGIAADDERQPVENVTVAVVAAGLEVLTGPDGSFEFPDLPEGPYVLAATHAEFNETTLEVFVLRELTVRADLTMIKRPEFRPFNLTVPFQGQYECAMEAFIVPGSCGILYQNTTCRVQYCQPDPFDSKYEFPIDIQPRWETLIVEVTWTQDAANALDGLRVYLENFNITGEAGHGTKVARVDGRDSPLTLRVDRGIPSLSAEVYEGTNVKAFIPDEGGRELIRVFPMGMLWDQTRQVCHERIGGCLLGVGVGLNVRFTVYVSFFYNEPAPAAFSAVPK